MLYSYTYRNTGLTNSCQVSSIQSQFLIITIYPILVYLEILFEFFNKRLLKNYCFEEKHVPYALFLHSIFVTYIYTMFGDNRMKIITFRNDKNHTCYGGRRKIRQNFQKKNELNFRL